MTRNSANPHHFLNFLRECPKSARAYLIEEEGLVPRGLKDILHTMQHFLKSPQKIGTVIPSSPFLARKMMDAVDIARAGAIVELGAGTGAITQELLGRTKVGAKVLIVDSNPDAVAILRQRLKEHENLHVVLGDARELKAILREHRIETVDAVVSSLPYASLGDELTRSILSAVADVLANDGHLVAFQYTPLLRKTLEYFFDVKSSAVELRNIPPAVVYLCAKKLAKENAPQLKDSA